MPGVRTAWLWQVALNASSEDSVAVAGGAECLGVRTVWLWYVAQSTSK